MLAVNERPRANYFRLPLRLWNPQHCLRVEVLTAIPTVDSTGKRQKGKSNAQDDSYCRFGSSNALDRNSDVEPRRGNAGSPGERRPRGANHQFGGESTDSAGL